MKWIELEDWGLSVWEGSPKDPKQIGDRVGPISADIANNHKIAQGLALFGSARID